MTDKDYPDVDELTNIGDSMKERLHEAGYNNVFDVANASPIDLLSIKRIGGDKADNLVDEAQMIIDNEFFTQMEWNPNKEKFEEVEPDIYSCEYCGKPFNQKPNWTVHQNSCSKNPSND